MDIYKKRRRRVKSFLIIIGLLALFINKPNQASFNKLAKAWDEFFTYELRVDNDFQPDVDNLKLLSQLDIKGRAPKTGYTRDAFSRGWGTIGNCNTRNYILGRDLLDANIGPDCKVNKGHFIDPYSGVEIEFMRGPSTSELIQIDHVVAVSDAWQKGAQALTFEQRNQFYNDPLNLLAVGKDANQEKSDSDAASWLPSNKSFRCEYVGRQVQVKTKYKLWVTQAEHDVIERELTYCKKVKTLATLK